MKFRLKVILLFILFLVDTILSGSLVIYPPDTPRDFTSEGTYYHNSGSNTYFAVNQTMSFSQIILDENYVQFNNTKFYITSPNRINISLDFLNTSMNGSNGDLIISMYAHTTTGTVYFNLSGFTPDDNYTVVIDDVNDSYPVVNASGFISFNISSWSEHLINITFGGLGEEPPSTIYYVDDSNPTGGDGSWSNPWKTIQRGLDNVTAGDTLYIMSGIYDESCQMTTSGTSDNWITISNYTGETPIIDLDNGSISWGNAGFRITDASYIIINGLTVRNIGSTGAGIVARGDVTHHIKIQNCTVYHTRLCGIAVVTNWSPTGTASCHDIWVEYNELSDCNLGASWECLSLSEIYNFHVNHNWVHDTYKEGIDVKVGCHDGEISYNHVETNQSSGEGPCIYIDCFGYDTYNIDVYNNYAVQLYDGHPFSFGFETITSADMYGITVYNNIFVSPDFSLFSYAENTGSTLDADIYNNAIIGELDTSRHSVDDSATIIRNNIVTLGVNTTGTDDHNYEDSSPGWVGGSNPSTIEGFNLTVSSVCIDNGTTTGLPVGAYTDYWGNSRISSPDIGSMEYQIESVEPDAPQDFTAVNYNNSRIDLTWSNDPYADKTSIISKKGSSPSSHSDGTEIYNSTGESYSNIDLDIGSHYYYKAWSYNTTSGFSTNFSEDDAYTSPGNPSGLTNGTITANSINLSWTNGVNYSKAVLRYKTTNYPISPQDGTSGYNGTGNSVNLTDLYSNTTYYFRLWNYINPFSEGNISFNATTGLANITVLTNGSTNVEETSATLNGFLEDSEGQYCYVGFEFGETLSYGETFSDYIEYNETVFRPNAIGTYNQNALYGATYHYQAVDDVIPDGYTTFVMNDAGNPLGFLTDTYNIPNHTVESGDIDSIEVFIRCLGDSEDYAKETIIVDGSLYYGTQYHTSGSWVTHSYVWDVNPKTGLNWTWDDIDDLEIGVSLHQVFTPIFCTQVYAIVNYSLLYISPYEFNYNVSDLSTGTLYHYRAFANFSGNTSYGDDVTFLTKPLPPSNLDIVVVNSTMVNVSWVKGNGANKTVILRKTIGYPVNYTDGTEIYNGTGLYVVDTGLSLNVTYYYRAWSYTVWDLLIRWSDENSSSNITAVLDPPYNPSISYITQILNITWSRGNGSDEDVVVYKDGSYPTTWNDGTIIDRTNNYTGSPPRYYYTTTITEYYYYCIFSYNVTEGLYSEPLEVPFYGGLGLNCFNESNPYQAIPFNILISNIDGSQTYEANNLNNTHWLNIGSIPYGDDTIFYVSSDGYKSRTYYYDIAINNFYNLSFYLPPDSSSSGGGTSDCYLQSFINSISISNPDEDADITLSHNLVEIIQVEIYNQSLYGTYGGWLFISENYYDYTSSHVVINQSILDVNTTMARVTYYFLYCPNATYTTPLYYIRIIETIEADYDSYDKGVESARVTIKKYINKTGVFETISIVYSDANGYVNLYLLPYTLYKVFINKSGYYDKISDYIPQPSNEWGQTTEKVFKINRIISQPDSNATKTFEENCVFKAEWITSNETIKITFIDKLSETTYASFRIYEQYNGSLIFKEYKNFTGLSNIVFYSIGRNTSRIHFIYLNLTHNILGTIDNKYIFLLPLTDKTYNASDIEELLSKSLGEFEFGWFKTGILYAPAIIILFALAAIKLPGIGLLCSGAYLFIVNSKVHMDAVLQHNVNILISLLLVFGFISLIIQYRRFKR